MNLNLDALKNIDTGNVTAAGQADPAGGDASSQGNVTPSFVTAATNQTTATTDESVQNPLSVVNEHRIDDENAPPALQKIELKPIETVPTPTSPDTPVISVLTATPVAPKAPVEGIKLISLNSGKTTVKRDSGVKLLSMEELNKKKKTAEKAEAQKKLETVTTKSQTPLEEVMAGEPPLFAKLSPQSHQAWAENKERYRKYQQKQRQRVLKYGAPVMAFFMLAIGITFTMNNNPLVASLSGGSAPNSNTAVVAQANQNGLHPASNQNSNPGQNRNGNDNANSVGNVSNANQNGISTNRNSSSPAPVSGAQFVSTIQQDLPKVPEVKQKELETAFTSNRTLTVFEAVKASMITFNIPVLVPRITFARQDAYVEKFALKNNIVGNKAELDEPLNDEFLERIQEVVKQHVTER